MLEGTFTQHADEDSTVGAKKGQSKTESKSAKLLGAYISPDLKLKIHIKSNKGPLPEIVYCKTARTLPS